MNKCTYITKLGPDIARWPSNFENAINVIIYVFTLCFLKQYYYFFVLNVQVMFENVRNDANLLKSCRFHSFKYIYNYVCILYDWYNLKWTTNYFFIIIFLCIIYHALMYMYMCSSELNAHLNFDLKSSVACWYCLLLLLLLLSLSLSLLFSKTTRLILRKLCTQKIG